MDKGQLEGKVAIVTGGGRGIGRAIAQRFAQEGASVAILSIEPEDVASAVAEIEAAGGRALGSVCDVTKHAEIPRQVQRVVEELGPIDVLVNNAHDTSDINYDINRITPEKAIHQINCAPIASMCFMQACYPHMKDRGGRIINLGSAAGVAGMQDLVGYAMAKEATRALTRCAARAWAQEGITVNTIAPSAATPAVEQAIAQGSLSIETLNPMGRMGSALEDVAPAAVFLASEASRFITGHTLFVDGGAFMDAGR